LIRLLIVANRIRWNANQKQDDTTTLEKEPTKPGRLFQKADICARGSQEYALA